MQIGYTEIAEPLDCTPLYTDLPGGVCPCPHWGYIFEGSITARYPNSDLDDETARAGEVYYFPAEHILIYDEPTKALEFNPPEELETVMTAVYKKLEELRGPANQQPLRPQPDV